MSEHIIHTLYHTFYVAAGSFSKLQVMNVYTFSLLRKWSEQTVPESGYEAQPLFTAVREYCNILVEQCFRPAHKQHDIALQKAVSTCLVNLLCNATF
jgi:hypothetical protein